MALASVVKVVLGSIAFAIFWVLAVFPAVPFLPIGRTAGSLLGAMLMVVFRVLTPDQAYASIDLPILGLLFGTMVVSIYLERADMFKYLGMMLSWKILTEFVLKTARQHNLPPHPFLLALASSANIGSSATPIGNPQNLVIAVQSKISFGNFLIGILPAMLMGVFVNALILICMYWKLLSIQKDEEDEWNSRLELMAVQSPPHMSGNMGHVEALRNRAISSEIEIQKDPIVTLDSTRNSNASKEAAKDVSTQVKEETIPSKRVASMDRLRDALSVRSSEGKEDFTTKWKKLLWKSCVYLVTIGMLIALLMGLNMSWTAITAAFALVVLDFKDARPSLEKVSYSLLIFFCGMFITVDGFNRTGIPSTLWDLMEPYSRIDHVSGIAILAIVILVMSNLASNVPTVLLLGARVAASAAAISEADEKKAWLILAWVSTDSREPLIIGIGRQLNCV
uniref:Citrate transporter-like domain-containing protein n=1 Tax=Fagus sylvatica TaxID=28930 RepID=A0A2N9IYV0_FAGSY